MRVVGGAQHFAYGPESGASGCFRARAHHASVEPHPDSKEHLKVAYFFRASAKGERRVKRALAADGGAHELELAQRRRLVTHELNAFTFEAQALSGASLSA